MNMPLDGIIAENISRSNRNLFIANLVMIITVIFLAVKLFPNLFVSMMVPSNNFRIPDCAIVSVEVILASLGIWNIKKALQRNANPEKHPIISSLAKFGAADQIACLINREVWQNSKRIGRSITISPSWIIEKRLFGAKFISLREIIWIYNKVTQHYTNFIPSGKSYSVVFWGRDGVQHEYPMGKDKCELFLATITEYAPWIIAGFDKQLEKLWHDNAADVILAVLEKQKKFANTKCHIDVPRKCHVCGVNMEINWSVCPFCGPPLDGNG